MGRLSIPDDSVGMDYVIGCKNSKYFVPSISHVDDTIKNLTSRINRWEESDKFPDLVETLTEDRNRLLDRRIYLMMLTPAADLGTDDRGLIR